MLKHTEFVEENQEKNLAHAAIDILMSCRAVSGFGQFHTANPESKNPKPYVELPWVDIPSMVKNPASVPKEEAQWAIFSNTHGENARVHQFQRDHGQFFCAWGDIDNVSGLTMLDVISRTKTALPGINCIIYSSRSARPDLPKSRVLVPFSGIVQGADYSMIQKILNDRLEAAGLPPDRATERPGQLCYLPNRGEFYQYEIIDGPLLDPYQAFESEIIAEQARLKAEQQERDRRHRAAIQKAQERINTGQADPIEAYKQTYPVDLALERYGYSRHGKKYTSPLSESGKPGVTVKNDKWYSHHSSDSGIWQPGKDGGTWGDAFDLFVYYEHGGDFNRAVQAAGALFTTTDQATGQVIPITKFNQREYMRQQAASADPTPGENTESIDTDKTIQQAKSILGQALSEQADDPGALYTDDALDAYSLLRKSSIQDAMRYRDLMTKCKNLQIGKLEHAAAARKNLKKYGTEGRSDNVMAAFNKSHAGVMLGGQFRILEEIKDRHNRPDIRVLSVPDFHNRYSNKWMPDPSDPAKTVQASSFWMRHEDRRDFMGGIDFRPKGCPKDTYNLFQGFTVKPKKGDWSKLKRHVYEVLAAGNKNHGDYLLAWCAKILQTPWDKNITCPVLISGQGAGKNTFIEAFGRILGQHFKAITNTAHLSGKFNSHMKDCLLLFCNEAVWGGDRQGAGQIKSLITDPTIRVELKGKDSFEVDNYINLIVASNSEWAVPAEKGDRRYFVLKVSDHRQGDKAYFDALYREINSGGVEAMMSDLISMDISGVDLRKIDRTEALMGQILEGMSSTDAYWFHRLKDGYLLPALYDETGQIIRHQLEWDQPVVSDIQFNDYQDFCAQNRMNHPKTDAVFGKFFSTLYPGMPKPKRLSVKEYPTRVMCREFLPLDECRRIYAEKVLGMNADIIFPAE